ncbi:MAG: proline dehydrogenase family protein, partial [Halobacteriaceae archaeon]
MIPPIARRFIAGETPEAALDHTNNINSDGIGGILNLLGEHYHDRQPANEDVDAYLDLIETIDNTNVNACISVKPSQLGLEISEDFFTDNLYRIVEHGDEHGIFVWIDMEDSDTTDATLDGFESVTTEFKGGVGVCVQANLRRTKNDLERLADLPGKVRLVKGAYDEPVDIAYQDKSRVNEAFKENLEFMFQEFDDGIAVGSHDSTMIDRAKQLHREHGTPFE